MLTPHHLQMQELVLQLMVELHARIVMEELQLKLLELYLQISQDLGIFLEQPIILLLQCQGRLFMDLK